MNPFTGVALFLMIWWLVIFAVLPIGIKPMEEADQATGWRGAPERPHMWKKFLITTVISVAIWIGCYIVITGPWLSFRH